MSDNWRANMYVWIDNRPWTREELWREAIKAQVEQSLDFIWKASQRGMKEIIPPDIARVKERLNALVKMTCSEETK